MKYLCGCEINGSFWIRACATHKSWCFYPFNIKMKTVMACIILDKKPEQIDAYEDQLVFAHGYVRDPKDDRAKIEWKNFSTLVRKVEEFIPEIVKCQNRFHYTPNTQRDSCSWCRQEWKEIGEK